MPTSNYDLHKAKMHTPIQNGLSIQLKCFPSVLVCLGEGGGESTQEINMHIIYSYTQLYFHIIRTLATAYCTQRNVTGQMHKLCIDI